MQALLVGLSYLIDKIKEYHVTVLLIVLLLFVAWQLTDVLLATVFHRSSKQVQGSYQHWEQVPRRIQKPTRETLDYFVENTSPRFQALTSLVSNASVLQFKNGAVINFPTNAETICTTMKSEYQFKRLDVKQELIYALKRALKDEEQLKVTKRCIEIEKQYQNDLKNLPGFMTAEAFRKLQNGYGMSFEEYAEIEKELRKKREKEGYTDWNILLKVKCIPEQVKDLNQLHTMNKLFTKSEIMPMWNAVTKSIESNEYQRMLCTPKIRYEVLKRDKFTCQICGRGSKEGAKLHVDHIRPVSKGGTLGETTKEGRKYSNLRTLCDLCNIGKSDTYDPVGLN